MYCYTYKQYYHNTCYHSSYLPATNILFDLSLLKTFNSYFGCRPISTLTKTSVADKSVLWQKRISLTNHLFDKNISGGPIISLTKTYLADQSFFLQNISSGPPVLWQKHTSRTNQLFDKNISRGPIRYLKKHIYSGPINSLTKTYIADISVLSQNKAYQQKRSRTTNKTFQ